MKQLAPAVAAGTVDGRPVEDVHVADAAVRYYADELDVLEHYLCRGRVPVGIR